MIPAPVDDVLQRAVDDSLECFAACEETVEQCLAIAGDDADTRLVNTLITTAAVCDAAAYFSRNSDRLRREALRFCAEQTERCAEACDERPADPQLATCARLCRICSRSCRKAVLTLV